MNATLTTRELAPTNIGPFTCPCCKRVSHNYNDTLHGWCGACHRHTAIPLFDDNGMKVLVVGDTHGSFRWLIEDVVPYAQATGCRTIMQVGDFGFIWQSYGRHVDEVLDHLQEIMSHAGITLHFLPGNHENHDVLERLASDAPRSSEGHLCLRPSIMYTGRYAAWTWADVRIAAVGGGISIDRYLRTPGVSWWPQEALTQDEVRAASEFGPVDILFSHDSPIGIPMPLLPNPESTAHRVMMTEIGRALRPHFWFHGHYHFSAFYTFEHDGGRCAVRSLDRDHTDAPQSMVVVNLQSVRNGLDVIRRQEEAKP